MDALTIEVPGTLSNLGPGYDTLGLAITLRNRFHLQQADAWVADGQAVDPASHLVLATAREACRRFGGRLEGLAVHQVEQVPRARGLGSSATARVAGLLAAERLGGAAPDPAQRLAFLAEGEGHPDNVVPALLGGLQVVAMDPDGVAAVGLPLPRVQVALAIPAREVSTDAARAALPSTVPHADAVANLGHLAFLLAGLASGDPESLRRGAGDRLHQPWRMPLIGPAAEAFAGAVAAGALGAFVSGSGSTLAAWVAEGGDAEAVAQALAAPFRAPGQPGAEARVVQPSATGATVTR